MTFPYIAILIVSVILATTARLHNSTIEADSRATELNIHYAKDEEALVSKVTTARDTFVNIYNKLPLSLGELIDKGLLEESFRESDIAKKITLENGNIKYVSGDVEFSNLYIATEIKKYEANNDISSTASLRNQTKAINMIKSNDADEMKAVDFSNIVKSQNSDLANDKKEDLELKQSEIKEKDNIRNNEMLKTLSF